MGSFTKREQIVILLLVIAIIIVLSYSILGKNELEILQQDSEGEYLDYDRVNDSKEMVIDESNDDENITNETNTIMVHISGEVKNPGLIVLKEGDRVVDAVEKAGGLKEEADMDRINLAKRVSDEEKIYIPKLGEVLDYNDLAINSNEAEQLVSSNENKININRASRDQLITLPGIGEALADRIIEYRSKSRFQSINELTNVSGIGDKKFQDIKDLVIVE